MLVEVKNLYKEFILGNKKIDVLKGLNFQIDRGDVVSIVGESGVGKTTFIQVVGTIDKPTSGQIFAMGKDITRFTDEEIDKFRARFMGFVFQFHNLLMEFSAIENVALPALLIGEDKDRAFSKAEELLKSLNLGNRLNHRPGELSGGEQQRVAIARAMINEPPLVLADEPTGNLDLKTQEIVFDALLKLVKEKKSSLVIATHNLTLAKNTDKIFELVDGKLREFQK